MVRARSDRSALALGGVYVVMTLTMAVSLARRSRQIAVDGPAAAAEQRFRRVNVLVLVLVAYAVAIQMSATTVESIPAFGNTLSGRAGSCCCRSCCSISASPSGCSASVKAVNARSRAAARQDIHGDATPDDAWKVGGLFYFNPRDPAIWVENRVGLATR